MKPDQRPEITDDSIQTVQSSFARSSMNHQRRPDTEQTAWQYLLNRKTRWREKQRLRSQSRNAINCARRTLAIKHRIDRQTTLSALHAAAVFPKSPMERMPTAEDEMLSTYARCLVCALAIRNVRVYRRSFSTAYFDLLKSTACDMAMTSGRVPSAKEAAEELQSRELSDLLQSLANA